MRNMRPTLVILIFAFAAAACAGGPGSLPDGAVGNPDANPTPDAPPDAPGPPACSDGLDNDGDGQTDYPYEPGCLDAEDGDEMDDCPSGPNCPPCGNGIDDDQDCSIDMNDLGCAWAADDDEYNIPLFGCPGPYPWEDISSTRTASASFDGTGMSYVEGTCGGGGPERFYYLMLPEGTHELLVSTSHPETTLDTVVTFGHSCTGDLAPELACNDDFDSAVPGPSGLTVTVEGCEFYLITVDSYAPDSVGDFLLTVTESAP
jgi:hypothetical protein